jgi:cysteinyl-tRNA synthetase
MRLFNTLGKQLQDFHPRDEGQVAMYVCGPTVQSPPHLGHGRYAVAFDVIRRYLEWKGYEVTYVENVTDIEDKIIAAAAEEGVTTAELAARMQAAFTGAFDRLGVRSPDIRPNATDNIPEMIALIEGLIAAGFAYPAANGDVYYRVRRFDGYGKLSGRRIDELVAGARVEPGEEKEDPLDFALWKASKPGEPSWPSPWGDGRPGWHIECSAMSTKYLGEGFDIHGGGSDLIFPHHENEIAQSEAHGGRFATYWLHSGLVNLGEAKMAKSTGNVVDLASALDQYIPAAVRLFYLRTHYRKPIEFSEEALDDATASLHRLWQFRRRPPSPVAGPPDPDAMARFEAFMDDDFDNAGALSVLFDVVREGNALLDAGEDAGPLVAAYDEIVAVFGIGEPAADLADLRAALGELADRFDVGPGEPELMIDQLVAKRARARSQQDWSTSDELREALAQLGIVVEDGADGTRWHRA